MYIICRYADIYYYYSPVTITAIKTRRASRIEYNIIMCSIICMGWGLSERVFVKYIRCRYKLNAAAEAIR